MPKQKPTLPSPRGKSKKKGVSQICTPSPVPITGDTIRAGDAVMFYAGNTALYRGVTKTSLETMLGAGQRSALVLKVGTKWVTMINIPSLTVFRLKVDEIGPAKLTPYAANFSALASILRTKIAEANIYNFQFSESCTQLALKFLMGETSHAG